MAPRKLLASLWGGLIGVLGGLIGLGGAEFRLPVLVGVFRLPTLKAIILNKAMSLGVVACALVFRMKAVPFEKVLAHQGIVLNLLAGSLLGAWFGAGRVMQMSRLWLDRIVLSLLVLLALLMLAESLFGLGQGGAAFGELSELRWGVGVLAGVVIGVVAAVLGVAGGGWRVADSDHRSALWRRHQARRKPVACSQSAHHGRGLRALLGFGGFQCVARGARPGGFHAGGLAARCSTGGADARGVPLTMVEWRTGPDPAAVCVQGFSTRNEEGRLCLMLPTWPPYGSR